jgi:hypothetical protein
MKRETSIEHARLADFPRPRPGCENPHNPGPGCLGPHVCQFSWGDCKARDNAHPHIANPPEWVTAVTGPAPKTPQRNDKKIHTTATSTALA